MHFKDKVVWITGASSGIGAALAARFAEKGAKLILTARNVDGLRIVQEACSRFTTQCVLLPADMYDRSLDAVLVRQAIAAFGRLDIFIPCAGISQRSLAEQTAIDIDRQLMEVNFFAPAALTKLLLPQFRKQGSGHVVPIGSMAGLIGFPLRSGYAASKHALKGFFETIQTEHTVPGFYITIVSPGRIHTPISLSAVTASGAPHGVMDEGQLNGIPVAVCTERILNAIIRKRKRVLIARGERVLWWIWFLIPALYYRIARKKGIS